MDYDYPSPVDKLLTHSDCSEEFSKQLPMPNYLELGLTDEHVPALIRMALDESLLGSESEGLEIWAPIHAWRALGQLRAEAAIVPLLKLFDLADTDDGYELGLFDWITDELPDVYAMIGTAAIPALSAYIVDDKHTVYSASDAGNALKAIAEKYPDARDECAAAIARRLELFNENDPGLNGFLISDLCDLKAVEYAPLMEQAFAADAVDEMIMGDWNDVQVDLGLMRPEDLPPRPKRPSFFESFAPPVYRDKPEIGFVGQGKNEKKAKKTKRKQAKKSQKINRKKKK